MECSQYERLCRTQQLWPTFLVRMCGNVLVCPKLVLLWSVSTGIYAKLKVDAKLKIYGQLKIYSQLNTLRAKQPAREGLVRVASSIQYGGESNTKT